MFSRHFVIGCLVSMMFLMSGVESLSCLPCKDVTCPCPGYCKAGYVLDKCNCCKVCGKDLNERCGGMFDIFGKCGDGMKCQLPVGYCTANYCVEPELTKGGICVRADGMTG